MDRVNDLVKERAKKLDRFTALADQQTLTAEESTEFDTLDTEIGALADRIERTRKAQAASAATAVPVGDPLGRGFQPRVAAAAETDPYVNDEAAKARGVTTKKGLVVGGVMRMLAFSHRAQIDALEIATQMYGESHPITEALGQMKRALVASIGASGGFIVPPDYMAEIIELLYAATVVRSSGPRVIPMPRGTMTIPGLATSASASYGAEAAAITASQPTLRDIVASFKKLTALVPVSNDLMRYASPAADAMVRDNLVEIVALTEDTAFLLADGSAGQPRGLLSFANGWVLNQGGTAGTWLTTGNSTAAADNASFTGDPRFGNNGGNFITSTETYNLATAATELGGLVQKLDSANLKSPKRVWFANPRTKNYLFNVQNSLGVYVYREELSRGQLFGYPFKTTTEIGINYYDTSGAHTDCSFLFLTDMNEVMIFDSMQLELAVSRDGTYIDASGNTQSAFQKDLTLIRAVTEHDFQMRHDSGVAVDQFVRWAPAIS